MKDYVAKMVDNFPVKIKGKEKTPAAEDLFSDPAYLHGPTTRGC